MRKALFPLVVIGFAAGAVLYLMDAGYIRWRQPAGRDPAKAAPTVHADDGPVPPGIPPSPQARLSLSPLACPNALCSVTVTIKPLPRCHYGDVESVVSDLKYSRTKRVLISLEPVRPEEPVAPTAVREIAKEDLYNGTTLRLSFPQVRRRAVMGVFLCKDSSGSGRCGDKEAVGARDVQRELSEAFRNPDFQARDKIYYFNPVYVARDALAIATDTERPEPSAWRERMYYVASTARTEDTPKVSEAVLKASGLIHTLTNFPLKYENESLVVVLPYFNSKCTR